MLHWTSNVQICSADILNRSIIHIYWRRCIVVIATVQLPSSEPELRFSIGSNPAGSMSEIHDCEDL